MVFSTDYWTTGRWVTEFVTGHSYCGTRIVCIACVLPVVGEAV